MKKMTLLLAAALCFVLCACGAKVPGADTAGGHPEITDGSAQGETGAGQDGADAAPGGEMKPAEDAAVTPAEDGKPTENSPAESDGTGDAGQEITLPILDEIMPLLQPGTAGSSLKAVQAAAQLLDWGTNTGLDPEEIRAAAEKWLAAQDEDTRAESLEKLALADEYYGQLLEDGAEDLLEDAECADMGYPWSSGPVESIEAIMQAAGLRD